MELNERMLKNKDAMLRKWFEHLLETYPPETARFMKREPNQFANPVGHTLHQGMEGVLEGFLQGMDPQKISSSLDKIIRIRAVQTFAPSQAVAFVLYLKRVIRDSLSDDIRENRVSPAVLETLDSQVDEIALLAFDIYMQCRETLYENRVNEVKNRSFRLLQRANLVVELPDTKIDPEPKHT
ncbi:MAG: hypothetical protein GX422_14455 [Deltaproteobacteria bacterium]|jgi:hypothetical protein|nr:hypothetical protein [Deltaproteobacteria bacterium]